ncbi:MAG: hypothetical protein Q8K22_02350 [Rhodoferax sp.]|jgi:hypothetical protein|nr:hypothetical protein [Rhodoferax sp.]
MKCRLHPIATKALVFGAVLCVLLAVFSLYTRPDFMLTLANEVWSCF